MDRSSRRDRFPTTDVSSLNAHVLRYGASSYAAGTAILAGRAAEPAELASPCLYLASDDASYVNGTSLVVDGGWEIGNYPDLRPVVHG